LPSLTLSTVYGRLAPAFHHFAAEFFELRADVLRRKHDLNYGCAVFGAGAADCFVELALRRYDDAPAAADQVADL